MRYLLLIIAVVIGQSVLAADLKLIDLPQALKDKSNGPDINLNSKQLKNRYGRDWFDQELLDLYSFNTLLRDQLDIMVVYSGGETLLVAYTSHRKAGIQLSDKVVDFLVKKNFPKAEWNPWLKPLKEGKNAYKKAFISKDKKYTWTLSKDGSQLSVGRMKKAD